MESPRLPTFTSRPRAVVKVDSSFGRKLFTFITKGRTINTDSIRVRRMPTILSARFISLLEMRPVGTGQLAVRTCGPVSLSDFGVLRSGFDHLQRLFQIGDQVVGVFNSYGEPEHLLGD